jgi:hypothetical protein
MMQQKQQEEENNCRLQNNLKSMVSLSGLTVAGRLAGQNNHMCLSAVSARDRTCAPLSRGNGQTVARGPSRARSFSRFRSLVSLASVRYL